MFPDTARDGGFLQLKAKLSVGVPRPGQSPLPYRDSQVSTTAGPSSGFQWGHFPLEKPLLTITEGFGVQISPPPPPPQHDSIPWLPFPAP